MSFIYFINTILFFVIKTSILVVFLILEFIKACYIIYYQSALYIYLYIYLFLLLPKSLLSRLLVK